MWRNDSQPSLCFHWKWCDHGDFTALYWNLFQNEMLHLNFTKKYYVLYIYFFFSTLGSFIFTEYNENVWSSTCFSCVSNFAFSSFLVSHPDHLYYFLSILILCYQILQIFIKTRMCVCVCVCFLNLYVSMYLFLSPSLDLCVRACACLSTVWLCWMGIPAWC